jgi:hypothetical protein
MPEAIELLIHFFVSAMKQQLIIMNRGKKRAPKLATSERFLFGLLAVFIGGSRLKKIAVIIKPTTILVFHKSLVNRKYSRLYSNNAKRSPGRKPQDQVLIDLVIEMKKRNPSFGYGRISMQILEAFGITISRFAVHSGDCDGVAYCRMFNDVISGKSLPKYLSSDNDPLFLFHRWQCNLRVLDVEELKSVPGTPTSHPFIERVIGTTRREYLDHTVFFNERDLQIKLNQFQVYYNEHRVHSSLGFKTPKEEAAETITNRAVSSLENYRWESHCKGLYQLPVAA